MNEIQLIKYCTKYGPYALFAAKEDMIFNTRQGFRMRNLNLLHHLKQSLYYINSTPLSITNNLHCPSIKRAAYISCHQCLVFINKLQYTTLLILKSVLGQVFIVSLKIWALRFIYFLYKILS